MAKKFLVADLLCGAGGSSTGCQRALAQLGLKMELVCVNHWGVAIETHRLNHPHARHYCQDIASVRPHVIVPEGYLDLLMASPTCTHHSVARGGKPTSDQERSDPWHIVTWLTELRVRRLIIENVWEFVGWGPVDHRTGKPIRSRKGEYFNAWIATIRRLGFEPEWRKLNAANYGGATTRQRFILKARNDRRIVAWAPITHTKKGDDGKLALFPGVKPWRAAREIIDWSIKGRSIFGRPRPLAPKTLARILAGALKFRWPRPFVDLLVGEIEHSLKFYVARFFAVRNSAGRKGRTKRRALVRDLAARLRHFRVAPLEFAKGGRSAEPMLVTLRLNADGRTLDLPIPAIVAGGAHIAIADPVILNGRKNNRAKGVSTDPVPTLDTKGAVWLAEPFVVSPRHGKESAGPQPRSTEQPLPTITAGGSQVGVVEPFILSNGSTGAPRATSSDPLPTVTTGGAGTEDHPGCARPMLVEPFVLSRHAGGAPRSTDQPMPTQVAKHSHVLVAPYYGGGSGETCGTAEDPLPSPTTKARFGIVVPLTHSGGEDRALDVDVDPLPTVTTANRGELGFITAQFGERPTQAPRVHDVEEPVPAICATGHVNLVQAVEPLYDVLFRMLEPAELAKAMGFSADDIPYEFAGTKTEQIKQIGNAVSVEMMEAEVLAIAADAAPKAKAERNAEERRIA